MRRFTSLRSSALVLSSVVLVSACVSDDHDLERGDAPVEVQDEPLGAPQRVRPKPSSLRDLLKALIEFLIRLHDDHGHGGATGGAPSMGGAMNTGGAMNSGGASDAGHEDHDAGHEDHDAGHEDHDAGNDSGAGGSDAGSDAHDAGSDARDAGSDAHDATLPPSSCAAPSVSDGTHSWCAAAFGAERFNAALCSCSNVRSFAELQVTGSEATTSVGANGSFQIVGADVRVVGSVTVASNLSTSGQVDIGGDLKTSFAGQSGETRVHGNTYLKSAFAYTSGRFVCDGIVHTPAKGSTGQPFDSYWPGEEGVPAQYQLCAAPAVAPCVQREPQVAFDAPCRCDAPPAPGALHGALLDAIAAHHRDVNDDQVTGISPGALANVHGPTELALPCGTVYLDRIAGAGPVAIHASQRTVLVVGAQNGTSIELDGPLRFDVAPGAELDVVLAGRWAEVGAARIGNPGAENGLRIYSNAADFWPLGKTEIYAHLYLPNATLVTSGSAGLFGSLVAGSFENDASFTVTHTGFAPAACP